MSNQPNLNQRPEICTKADPDTQVLPLTSQLTAETAYARGVASVEILSSVPRNPLYVALVATAHAVTSLPLRVEHPTVSTLFHSVKHETSIAWYSRARAHICSLN